MACNFCDGADKNERHLPTSEAEKNLIKLKEAGVSSVVFTGGEPLLRKDMPHILKFAKGLDFEVYLSTNGLLLPRVYNQVRPYVDCIGLPLDGSSAHMHGLMSRDEKQYESTLYNLEMFARENAQHRIKIGTVVSAINKDDITNIGRVLFDSDVRAKPSAWRLYQFTPLGDGVESRSLHELSDDEFQKIVERTKTQFPSAPVSELSNAFSNDSYLFISPSGNLYTLTGDKYKTLTHMSVETGSTLADRLQTLQGTQVRGSQNRQWLDKPKEK